MEYTLPEKCRLVIGKGAWHTNDLGGKITSIHLSDGPHGLRKQDEGESENNKSYPATCFPTASAVACSFDPELIASMAQGIAREAKKERVSILLGPGTNMKRSPVCGRNFEYFSEDPFLAGKMATSYVNAVQGEGVGCSLKHFAGNSQETHRMTANSMIDERALREIYLSAFEMCVKEAQPATIMASYNRLNGEYACANKHLLTEILREKWGFEGLVMSDWGACNDLPACIAAGMDLEMPDSGNNHYPKLMEAMELRRIPKEALERAVSKVTEMVENYAYPEPKLNDDGEIEEEDGEVSKDQLLLENYQLAKRVAKESAVLLKNNGILPLASNAEVLLVGSMAEHVRFQGGGSSHIYTQMVKDCVTALENQGLRVTYIPGYDDTTFEIKPEWEEEVIRAIEANAAKAKRVPILFCGGLTDIAEGEGYDRTTFAMPKNQEHLLNRITEMTGEVVFISFSGSPYDCKVVDEVDAMLQMYLGGEAVADAMAELVTGVANPCGKLAETFPYSLGDTPCYDTFGTGSDDVPYKESIFIGYRYYDTFSVPVRFPFGYGLSYTEFAYSGLSVKKKKDGNTEVKFTIKNVGECAGKEIAQVYVKNPAGEKMRANKELRGFVKVELKKGESKKVSVLIPERAFRIFDEEADDFVTIPGTYEIQVGRNVSDICLIQEYEVKVDGSPEESPIKKLFSGKRALKKKTDSVSEGGANGGDGEGHVLTQRERFPSYFPENKEMGLFKLEEFGALYGKPMSHLDLRGKGDFDISCSLSQLSKHSMMGKILHGAARKIAYKMYPDKPHDDPEVMMMLQGIDEGTLDCVLNNGGGVVPYKLGEAIVLSANGKKLSALLRLLKK